MRIYLRSMLAVIMLPALGLFAINAQANFIDLFSEGGQVVSDVTNGAEVDDAENFSEVGAYGSILGGYRDIKVDTLTDGIDLGGDAKCSVGDSCTTMSVNTTANTLSFNNDAGVEGVGIIQWDGQDNSSDLTINSTGDGTNLGDGFHENFITQDGCGAGCNRFTVEVLEADQDFIFTIGVYTDATHWTEFDLVSSGIVGVKEFLFSDFQIAALCGVGSGVVPGVAAMRCGSANGGYGVVDFTDVNAMQMVFNVGGGTTAVDLRIGAVEKIPEPGVLALFGLGLAAAGAVRRRRNIGLDAG